MFFFLKNSQHDNPKKSSVKSITKDLLGKNATKLPYFEGKKILQLSYLDNMFQDVTKTKQDSGKKKKKIYILAKFGSFLLWMVAHPCSEFLDLYEILTHT
jgi:hypothetical protein